MKKHITKIAILFLMISLAGCRKDFLDREPISDLTEGNFFLIFFPTQAEFYFHYLNLFH